MFPLSSLHNLGGDMLTSDVLWISAQQLNTVVVDVSGSSAEVLQRYDQHDNDVFQLTYHISTGVVSEDDLSSIETMRHE